MLTGLLAIGAILLAMGWFAIGWIARGHENRKYAESRLRALADRSLNERMATLTQVDAHRIDPLPDPAATPVIHVHMPPVIAPVWPQPPVINRYPIQAIEGEIRR